MLIPSTAETPFPIYDYLELDSTNSEAKRLVAQGVHKAFVVSAKKQTKGRGRFNRVWHSPESNAAFTIYVPRLLDYQDFSTLSLMTGLAICRALEDLVGSQAALGIKWPNDVVINDAKVSGTLIEADDSSLFVGIGVNLVSEPSEVFYPTISLQHFTNIDRLSLVQTIAKSWHREFDLWSRLGFKAIAARYSQKLWRQGDTIAITLDAGRQNLVKGRCLGVNEKGLLLLDVPEEGVRAFSTGDVGA